MVIYLTMPFIFPYSYIFIKISQIHLLNSYIYVIYYNFIKTIFMMNNYKNIILKDQFIYFFIFKIHIMYIYNAIVDYL
jgi:hypothetical protein